MTVHRHHHRIVAACLALLFAVAACGSSSGGQSPGATAVSSVAAVAAASAGAAPSASVPTSSVMPVMPVPLGEGGDAWCQSIVAMTAFMAEDDSLRALAGTAVPDGPARSQKLQGLIADMRAKAPSGHDADWAILDQIYDLWVQQLASPTKDRLGQMQALTTSDAMQAAQANLHDDIVKACPNVKGLGA